MKKSLLLIVMSLFLLIISAVAQEKTVTGTVTDNNGLTLPGVSVKVKGTLNGTSTGPNGEYSIRATPGAVLQFSFIGTSPTEKAVGSSNILNVKLINDTKSLNEVVVVGYGTQKKATLTGAISTVDVAEVLSSRPTTDVVRALQGAVPGLTITSPSGALGSNPSIRLRGISGSLNGVVHNP